MPNFPGFTILSEGSDEQRVEETSRRGKDSSATIDE